MAPRTSPFASATTLAALSSTAEQLRAEEGGGEDAWSVYRSQHDVVLASVKIKVVGTQYYSGTYNPCVLRGRVG